MAQTDPWAEFRVKPAGGAMPQQNSDPILKPADPYKQSAEERARADQVLQERKFRLDQEKMQADLARQDRPNPGPGYRLKPDGTAEPIPGSKEDPQASQSRQALAAINSAGIDTNTGVDPVAELIKGSTSGMLQKLGADAYGAVTGDATSGMENIGRLKTIASDLTLQMTGGSLGAQVSNSDRDFIVERIGNIADASVPADQRLAAWEQVKLRLAKLAGLKPEQVGFQQRKDAQPAYYKNGGAYDKDGNYLGVANMPDGPAGGGNPPPDSSPSPPGMAEASGMAERITQMQGDPSGFSGLASLATRGVTLGLSDEAAGIGGYLGALLTGRNPSEAYTANRDAQRRYDQQAGQAWGTAGTGLEFLGGGGAARVASLPNSLLQAARQGATVGGVAGFGSGEGAQGSTVNALLGAGVGGALGAGGQAIGNRLASRAAANAPDMAVVEAGQRQGIPIRQPDARPNLRGQMAQVESTQAGGPMIRATREADANAIEQRIAQVGGQGNASDPYALGTRVQEAGDRYIAKTKAQATRLYDKARELSGNATVTPRNADAVLDQNIQELRAAGENSNASAISYLEGLRNDIDRGLSLEAVQNLRTNMRGQISGARLTGTDTERRVMQVIDAMNQDLTEQLPKEASAALRAADSFYRERQTFINNTLKQFMGDRGNPLPAETAAQRLVSIAQGKGNFDRFSRMWQQLEPAEQADVSATIAASLGRKQNGDFSVAALVKSLDPNKGINPRTARLVFGDDGARALQDLRAIAQAKTETMGRQSPSGVAIAAGASGLKKLLWGTMGLIGGGPGGAAAGAVGQTFIQQWGEQRAARMLLNPDFTRWLRNAPNTANPKAIDAYFSRLATTGIAANDNKAFQQAIMKAFQASPTSAAAQDETNGRRVPPQQ